MNLCVRSVSAPQPKVYALGWLGDGEDLRFGMVLLRFLKVGAFKVCVASFKGGVFKMCRASCPKGKIFKVCAAFSLSPVQ